MHITCFSEIRTSDDLEYDGVDVNQPKIPQIPSYSSSTKPKEQAQKLEDPSFGRPDSSDNTHTISETHYFWKFVMYNRF